MRPNFAGSPDRKVWRSFMSAIAAFLGRLLREILPAFFDEWRRRKSVKIIGKKPKDAVGKSIEDVLRKDRQRDS